MRAAVSASGSITLKKRERWPAGLQWPGKKLHRYIIKEDILEEEQERVQADMFRLLLKRPTSRLLQYTGQRKILTVIEGRFLA